MRFNRNALLSPRNIVIAAVFALAAAFVVGLYLNANKNVNHVDVGGKRSLPAVASQGAPDLSPMDALDKAFGPFDQLPDAFASNTPDLRSPHLLLIKQDGSEWASRNYTVAFNPKTWTHQSAEGIVAVSPTTHGYMIFHIDDATGSNTYIVRKGQPFVMQEYPQIVVLFAEDGSQWTKASNVAEHSPRRVG
jgi:hypothetical protein